MNRQIVLTVAAALAWTGTAYAQNQATPAPGAQATPGARNPSTSDPSTATPGAVDEAAPPATPPPQDTTGARSASSPRQREAVGDSDRSNSKSDQDMSTAGRTRMAAASPSGTLSAGTKVQSSAGTPLGTVKDIVPKANGQPGYVLITTPSGASAPVPYATIQPMIRNGHIVLDSSRLQGAPTVRDSELLDPANTRWKQQADDYWNGQGAQR